VSKPPANVAAEAAYLGALILDNSCINAGVQVAPAAFTVPKNRAVYDAMQQAVAANVAVDAVTLGGYGADVEYANQLQASMASSSSFSHYAKQINDAKVLRDLISASKRIAKSALEYGAVSDEVLARAQGLVMDLGCTHESSDGSDYGDILDDYEEAKKAGTGITGVTTGLSRLNVYLGGMQKTDLLVLAARPSMGKTALAITNMAVAACKEGKRIGVFSLEMSERQLKQRILAAEAGIDSLGLRNGTLREDEEISAYKVAAHIKGSWGPRLLVNDKSAITVPEVAGQLRQWRRDDEVDLIIVDYIQLMKTPRRGENRNMEIGEISGGLKGIAKESDIPVLALSQLGRLVERQNREPILSDLRDSGSIEQDADVVMFIHGEDNVGPQLGDIENRKLILAKQRNGPVGSIDIGWDKHSIRFVN